MGAVVTMDTGAAPSEMGKPFWSGRLLVLINSRPEALIPTNRSGRIDQAPNLMHVLLKSLAEA